MNLHNFLLKDVQNFIKLKNHVSKQEKIMRRKKLLTYEYKRKDYSFISRNLKFKLAEKCLKKNIHSHSRSENNDKTPFTAASFQIQRIESPLQTKSNVFRGLIVTKTVKWSVVHWKAIRYIHVLIISLLSEKKKYIIKSKNFHRSFVIVTSQQILVQSTAARLRPFYIQG